MFGLSLGQVPNRVLSKIMRCAIPAVCMGLGACATSNSQSGTMSANTWPGNAPRAQVAGYVETHPIEYEADGIEAQTPPRRRAQAEPDDPSEPFSPNYGDAAVATDHANFGERERDEPSQPSDKVMRRSDVVIMPHDDDMPAEVYGHPEPVMR